jgi:O6-methylguanine-DNA--protein-cysteine methyltransferase
MDKALFHAVFFLKPLFLQNILNVSKEGRKMKTFADKAYDLLRKVPKGRVTTYKEIAHALETKAYRGVGQAMRNNPYAPEVP